ncbi:LLM class flavin-dependent oxidoreductase [Streptomyces sp. AD2-2]|nr:LLM class flavin-dependent oxidoreductase [Streptomyces sp. AD2-2]
MAAAAAARTSRIRLGTAVVPAPLHAAPELAEQAAIVDIISDGRLDLGLGTGYRVPEYRLYGADLARRYSTTDQRVREIRGLWSESLVTPDLSRTRCRSGSATRDRRARAGPGGWAPGCSLSTRLC